MSESASEPEESKIALSRSDHLSHILPIFKSNQVSPLQLNRRPLVSLSTDLGPEERPCRRRRS